MLYKQYEVRQFDIVGIKGLSERQIAEHLKLYAGYVKNVNELMEKLNGSAESGLDSYIVAELRRRIGFEFNGMRLHEYYFGQLEKNDRQAGNGLKLAIEASFGSVEEWRLGVTGAASARGIGWVLFLRDRSSNNLLIQWVSDHDIGLLAGVDIIMALDLWEHAYLLDYLPSAKKDYLGAFFDNLNWSVLESRFSK